MKAKDYRTKTDQELKALLSELQERILRTHSVIESSRKEFPQNRTRLRHEVARIKTILRERELELKK